MPSQLSRKFETVARALNWKSDFKSTDPDLEKLRRFDVSVPPAMVRWIASVEEFDVGAFKAFTLFRNASDGESGHVLYFHGGCYAAGPFLPQWLRIAKLASGGKSRFTLLNYPKAPEYTVEDSIKIATDTATT